MMMSQGTGVPALGPWSSSPSATGDVLADPVTGATSPGLHGCPSLSHFTRPSPLTALPPALIVSCSLGLFWAFIFFFSFYKSAYNTMVTESCFHLSSFHFECSI